MVNIHKRDIDEPSEEFNVVLQAVILANDYLKNIGFELDLANIKVNGRHMSIPDPVAKKETQSKRYTEVGLGRTAHKITPRDPDIQAKAWIDASDGRPEIESNDRVWVENYLRMADNINEMLELTRGQMDTQEMLKENIKSHIEWVKGGIKVQKKLISLLEQKSLRGFLNG